MTIEKTHPRLVCFTNTPGNTFWAVERILYPFISIILCLNDSPLKEFLANEFTDVRYTYYINDTKAEPTYINNTVVYVNVTTVQPINDTYQNNDDLPVLFKDAKFEDYRKGTESWMSWQDSLILPVFILKALLSIGAIVAFKVLKLSNHIQITYVKYFSEKMFILPYPGWPCLECLYHTRSVVSQ